MGAAVLAFVGAAATAFYGYHQVEWSTKNKYIQVFAIFFLYSLCAATLILLALWVKDQSSGTHQEELPNSPDTQISNSTTSFPNNFTVDFEPPSGTMSAIITGGQTLLADWYSLEPPGCAASKLDLKVLSTPATDFDLKIYVSDASPHQLRVRVSQEGMRDVYVTSTLPQRIRIKQGSAGRSLAFESVGALGAGCTEEIEFGLKY
ncbi:hypothetical protein [Nostocoides australiense]|nr:hypothetical protein [Tetrasphaera australiensis]HRW67419.1 hypothetical protein [Candidatus Competibacter sp.]